VLDDDVAGQRGAARLASHITVIQRSYNGHITQLVSHRTVSVLRHDG
jgi:hypothetical protein